MTKPTRNSKWKKASIFIYQKSGVGGADPTAIILNRTPTTATTLFFTSLVITGAVNRAGTAKFSVVNTGAGSTAEWSIFDDTQVASGSSTVQKYVAIIVGSDIVWSGKILRSVQETQDSYYATSSRYCIWNVECESDIGKMKLQGIKSYTNPVINDTIGGIVLKLVKNATASDIDWSGAISYGATPLWMSVISNEGANLTYKILDSDMYTQFMALAKLSGYEWRTRLQTYVGTYGTDGWDHTAGTITNDGSASFYPYNADHSFNGRFVLFINDVNDDGTPNSKGVVSYGYCTDSDSATPGVITLTGVVNATTAPTSDGWFAVLLDPVVDLAWDLEPPVPVQTIRVNSAPDGTNFFGYYFNDKTDKKTLATKVTVKAKNVDVSSSTSGKSESISSTLYACNKWEPEDTMYENSTIVTQRMDGYIYSYTANSTSIILIGQGYAIQADDVFAVLASTAAGAWYYKPGNVVASITTQTQTDGTKTTTIVADAAIDADNSFVKYGLFLAKKAYVQDVTRLNPPQSVLFGGGGMSKKPTSSTGSPDPVYGSFISGDSAGPSTNFCYPILPGCLAYNSTPTGDSPDADSPLAKNGLISVTETVDQAITIGDLQIYATQALINHSFYLRKASLQCFITDFLKPGARGVNQVYDWQMIKEGDRIAVAPYSGVDLNEQWYDGQYKYKWEVISWTLDCTTMKVSIELGDYEPNVYSLMNSKTSALDRTIT